MDIKIPGGAPEGKAVDAIEDAMESVEEAEAIAEVKPTSPQETDAITRIAEQVAASEIDRDQAVERIMEEVLNLDIVKGAPDEIRQEVLEVLGALLKTDPHLKSLAAALGSPKVD